MTVSLRFDTPLDTSHPVDLLFNAPAVEVGDANIILAATIPAPTLVATLANIRYLVGSATLPAPTMTSVLFYDNAVYRGPNGVASNAWQDADAQPAYREDKMQDGISTPSYKTQPWQDAAVLDGSARSVMQSAIPIPKAQTSDWTDAISVQEQTSGGYQDMIPVPRSRATVWQDGVRTIQEALTDWQDRFRRPRPSLDTAWQEAVPAGIIRTTSAGVALPLPFQRITRWQDAIHLRPGHFGTTTPPDERHVCYTPPPGGNVNFRFKELFSGTPNLLFTCTRLIEAPATKVIPIRRVYIVINEAQLRRVDGDLALPTYSMTLKIDMDSWTWGFTASLPANQLSNLEPSSFGEPVELEATINGTAYRFLAEGLQRDREFAKSRLSVSGRGLSALLADPYSPILTFVNDEDRTAQQLMNDALLVNGVSIGWDVDWRIDDWLVPAGAWNYQGSHMAAVAAIAASAGAFIQPDPVAQTLRVRARYPVVPWDWAGATPDLELPSDVTTKEGIAWFDRPQYNAVYISGTTEGGILGQVKRVGSAGDVLAPMVTDALITAAAAARQRSIPILADTGRIATYTLSLPVLPESGIIDPGTLLRYVDNGNPTVGIVKSVSVNVALPSIRQTIEVETHV